MTKDQITYLPDNSEQQENERDSRLPEVTPEVFREHVGLLIKQLEAEGHGDPKLRTDGLLVVKTVFPIFDEAARLAAEHIADPNIPMDVSEIFAGAQKRAEPAQPSHPDYARGLITTSALSGAMGNAIRSNPMITSENAFQLAWVLTGGELEENDPRYIKAILLAESYVAVRDGEQTQPYEPHGSLVYPTLKGTHGIPGISGHGDQFCEGDVGDWEKSAKARLAKYK